MAAFPNLINIENEIDSIFSYLISHGFSREDAKCYLTDELPKANFERLFVWPVTISEGRALVIKFHKKHKNVDVDTEKTNIQLHGKFLCLSF